jgi:hypothetical protein
MFRPDIVYEDDHDLVIQAQDGYRWTWDTPDADPPKGEAFVPEDGAADHFGSCGREDIAECIRTRTAYIYGHREPF